MSVNGSGSDRNGKPSDSSSWSVKDFNGVVKDEKNKPISGVTFAAARSESQKYTRSTGIYAAPVRT